MDRLQSTRIINDLYISGLLEFGFILIRTAEPISRSETQNITLAVAAASSDDDNKKNGDDGSSEAVAIGDDGEKEGGKNSGFLFFEFEYLVVRQY